MSVVSESVDTKPQTDPLILYGQYPFDSDETYQQGLASLIGGGALDGNPSSDVKEEILRRTRVFYFNRITGNSISTDDVRKYEDSLRNRDAGIDDSTSFPPVIQTSAEARVLTFAELQNLIETGKVDQIPNNKVISDALNDALPSESTVPVRKKPWEMAGTVVGNQI